MKYAIKKFLTKGLFLKTHVRHGNKALFNSEIWDIISEDENTITLGRLPAIEVPTYVPGNKTTH